MEGEKTNENTQLGPTKINNVNGQSERTDAPSNRNTEGRPEGRKTFQKPKKKPDPDNITVLFVDQTPGGELAKRLQKVEDRLSLITGYRVRVTETADSQLCRILPNTNPLKGICNHQQDKSFFTFNTSNISSIVLLFG